MALLGDDFDPTIPRDTDDPSNGASEIRDVKRRLKDFVTVKFDPETGNFKSANSNITLASSDPLNPNLGDVYFNTVSLTAFVYTTAGWVPIVNSLLPANQEMFTASGSFTVPVGVRRLKIHAWGAGGGGSAELLGSNSGSGGGGGAYGSSIVTVAPGDVITFTVGTGGAGAAGTAGGAGADGGDTTILTRTAGGGKGATTATIGGVAGTASGFTVNLSGQAGLGGTGSAPLQGGDGGDAGSWGGKGGMIRDPASVGGRDGSSPGGGGCGGSDTGTPPTGSGANGAIILEY